MTQLSLFENMWQDSANRLLDCLNDGRKGKEIYMASASLKYKKLIIIQAVNYESKVYNVLDEWGNQPKGKSVCWRSMSHVINEI